VHAPPATPTHVDVRSGDGDVVVLTVADAGPGMDPDTAARAFERFYRGDPARSRATGGVGLGLSIVAAIVEAHGGTVILRPTDIGATFEIRIPTAGEAVAHPVPRAPEKA